MSTYNLLHEGWIPVLYADGKTAHVGLCGALKDAGKIRQLAASNPMDRVALLRFLIAVLLWCKDEATPLEELKQRDAVIPEAWLAQLKKHETAFNLLGDMKRFYQDASIAGKRPRPIADLLVEYPGADSVNHMRHVVHDGSYGFCPGCCALGILRLSVWAPANGSYPASVNPGSAAYAFVEGKDLLSTLLENLPEDIGPAGTPPWLLKKPPLSPDSIARLAWRPRKLWLIAGDRAGTCENCGKNDVLISNLCIEKGWPTPMSDGQRFAKEVELKLKDLGHSTKGKDRAARDCNKIIKWISLIRKCRMAQLRQACGLDDGGPSPATAEEIARLVHKVLLRGEADARRTIAMLTAKPDDEEKRVLGDGDLKVKKFWDGDPHLLKEEEPISLPGISKDIGIQSSKFWRDALRLQPVRDGKVIAIGPVVNKYVFQDATAIDLPPVTAKHLSMLSRDIGTKIGGLLKCVMSNPDRQHPEIQSVVALLTPEIELQVRNRLNKYGGSCDPDDINDSVFLHELYAPFMDMAVSSVSCGSPLQRQGMRRNAHERLDQTIAQLTKKPAWEVATDPGKNPPDEPGRGRSRKKRGAK